MLSLSDKWVWDFWFVRDGPDHHLFYLQAPRALGDPDLRHWHATIGHAVSLDLQQWELLPDVLGPGTPGAWDDGPIWTGTIVAADGGWKLFYTGTSHAERLLVQRIGVATSKDLVTWDRSPTNPVLEVDPKWYETLDLSAWHDQAWRDPFVFEDPDGRGTYHALITARARAGPVDRRGVIAHASSSDLEQWEIGPPLAIPREHGHLEVPQLTSLGGRWYLLVSNDAAHHASDWERRHGRAPRGGTYVLVGDRPLGPFAMLDDAPLGAELPETLYAGKLVAVGPGSWVLLAFVLDSGDGSFGGYITDPIPVTVGPDGSLVLGG